MWTWEMLTTIADWENHSAHKHNQGSEKLSRKETYFTLIHYLPSNSLTWETLLFLVNLSYHSITCTEKFLAVKKFCKFFFQYTFTEEKSNAYNI